MIHISDVRKIATAFLPHVEVKKAASHVTIAWVSATSQILKASAVIIEASSGTASILRLDTECGPVDVYIKKPPTAGDVSTDSKVLYAPKASLTGDLFDAGPDSRWIAHPSIRDVDLRLKRLVAESWERFPELVAERLSDGERAATPGYRVPQLGALHAIAAHWTIKTAPAKIVLPTGTGKTDVLISSVLMHRLRRVLFVVPSDSLRTQTADKLKNLQTLRDLGLINSLCQNPIVGVMTKAPTGEECFRDFEACHVVITTSTMLSLIPAVIAHDFIRSFEAVFFDEAHHLAAPTWDRALASISAEQKMLAVTATPFRNDGKKLPGETIYQFPLRLAQKLGYFKQIVVQEVNELDDEKADELIAEIAVRTLEADEHERGWKHVIMARAKSIKHAEELNERIYSKKYAHLAPVVVHSKTPAKLRREIIEGLRRLEHRVVVCVDMLGEGFDFAPLKIAAMHELHRSLPITLQFIGRFTRTASTVGTPTLVVNVAKAIASGAVSSLYEQDADWNDLLPEISARAIKSEHDIEEFVRSMETVQTAEGELFDLALIKPKTSATFYKVGKFNPKRFRRAFGRETEIHQAWKADDDSSLVIICKQRSQPDWSSSKGASDTSWVLFVAHYHAPAGLLYIHSSESTGQPRSLAKYLSGDTAQEINGEDMFKAFYGLNRTVLHNVGLYRKGNLRFQMLAGIDIGSHVSAATQAGSGKSNLFAVGYEDGQKVSVGVSFKGRAWSMSSSSIPDWIAWCGKVSAKITNKTIRSDEFFDYVLIPEEISVAPSTEVFACVVPDSMLLGENTPSKRFLADGIDTEMQDVDIAISYVETRGDQTVIRVEFRDLIEAMFAMQWGPFRVKQLSGPSLSVVQRGIGTPLNEYFEEHSPVLLLRDGSEVTGKYHFKSRVVHPYTFSPDSISPTDWSNTVITTESKWKNGIMRPSSVQGRMIELCVDGVYKFVIDDDDTGEAADIIGLIVDEVKFELEVHLFHCKYSSGSDPSARFKDLYEVCGQAVKSTRLVHRADALLEHIIAREGRLGGRPTRFEKGTLPELRELKRDIHRYRVRTKVAIVQPGLSAKAMTPELSSVLGAADNFVFEFTGRRLQVYGSA